MTFTQKLAAAGFVKPDGSGNKAEFARFVGYGLRQVQRWKDDPPDMALRFLDERIANIKFCSEVAKILASGGDDMGKLCMIASALARHQGNGIGKD